MKSTIKLFGLIVISGALLSGGLFSLLWLDDSPLLIESKESKTLKNTAVFNRIRFIPSRDRDVWMMQQSHGGEKLPHHLWDRLAIVVDKTQSPKIARYYQFEAGPLEWSGSLANEVKFRAACFTCHNNGPRAIRPSFNSTQAPLSTWNTGRVAIWNLRIKSYGRVVPAQEHLNVTASDEELFANKVVPFYYPGDYNIEPLKITACAKCHNDSVWGRGHLVRQQSATIKHLVDTGAMPPLGFSISDRERRELSRFINGF